MVEIRTVSPWLNNFMMLPKLIPTSRITQAVEFWKLASTNLEVAKIGKHWIKDSEKVSRKSLPRKRDKNSLELCRFRTSDLT